MELVSIVVTCLENDCSVDDFINKIMKSLQNCDFEIIFVGSDLSCGSYPDIKFVSSSGNFNQAALEGLRHACGDLVCMIDVSLSDSPRFLLPMIELLDKIDTDLDIVATKNVSNIGQSRITQFFAKFSKSSPFNPSYDYCVVKRSVVDYILNHDDLSLDFIENGNFKVAWCEY